jgi:hypothetical protein
MRFRVCARGDDNLTRVEVTHKRSQHKAAAIVGVQPSDGDALAHGRGKVVSVANQMAHNFVAGHESVWIMRGVRSARKLHGPVRDHQTETVPAAAPCLSHSATLQDNVLQPSLAELVAQRQAGLARAHDRDLNFFGHVASRLRRQPTSLRSQRSIIYHGVSRLNLPLASTGIGSWRKTGNYDPNHY